MKKRILGKSNIEVTPLGLGCMRLASWQMGGKKIDFTKIDEPEAISAIQMAIDSGINIFDTAAVYGAGSNERLLGKAIKGRREKVVIISKGGYHVDESRNMVVSRDGKYIDNQKDIAESTDIINNPRDIKEICEGSLERLGVDCIDIYLLHTFFTNDKFDLEKAAQIREYMEELVQEGKIKWYGWSTDWPHQAQEFIKGKHCTCIMQDLSVLSGNEQTLKLCEENNIASLNRTPLGGGTWLVENKPGEVNYRGEVMKEETILKMQKIKDILTADGRSIVQGLLGWIWARSKITIPTPGWDNKEHVKGLLGTLEYGSLSAEQMSEIEKLKKELN
jgi:aryl-alcohol dehydrogenase-like predicted oxidoreductase